MKALKSALETKHKKPPTSHWQQDPFTHTPNGLRKRWAENRPPAGHSREGRGPRRAKPVRINASAGLDLTFWLLLLLPDFPSDVYTHIPFLTSL